MMIPDVRGMKMIYPDFLLNVFCKLPGWKMIATLF